MKVRHSSFLLVTLLSFARLGADDAPPIKPCEGFRIVHFYGTPEEIGRQHAAAFADEIRLLRKDYLGIYLLTRKEREVTLEGTRVLEPFYLPRHRAELKAICDAGNIPWDDAVLATGFLDIKRIALCSTFVATGPAATGETVFGRNLDFPSLGVANKHGLCAVYHPAAGHTFAAFTYPGMIGALTGMNDRGLTLAVMNVYQEKPRRQAMPYVLFFRQLLEECETTAQVVERIKAGCCNVSNNLMVCDAKGDAALFEITPTRVEVRRGTDGLLMSTNHFRSEPLGKPIKLCWRYPIMSFMLGGHEGRIDVDYAEKTLRSVAIWPINLQSFVFLPGKRSAYVAMGKVPACSGTYVPVDLGAEFARPRK